MGSGGARSRPAAARNPPTAVQRRRRSNTMRNGTAKYGFRIIRERTAPPAASRPRRRRASVFDGEVPLVDIDGARAGGGDDAKDDGQGNCGEQNDAGGYEPIEPAVRPWR